jgi:hypothetical protein
LPEHYGIFHQISKNPFLVDEGIKIHSDALPLDELRERAWQIFKPQYQKRLMELTDDLAVAQSKGLDDVPKIAEAAVG